MKIHSAHYQRLTIDKQQFLRNIELLKQTATQPLHVVVKGNAYGHDLLTASSLFVEAGIERLITYHLSDALMLRKKYPDLSLLLIGPIELGDIAVCRAQNIEITVWDLPFLTTIRKVVQTQSSEWPSLRIHIEIETGMYRTGIVPADIFSLENEVFESVHYEIAGFCTHLSGADEPENIGRVQEQIEIFSSFRNEMMRRIQREFEWHGPNSAALALDTTQVFTHCRVGLLAYGFFPSSYARKLWSPTAEVPKPSLKWYSNVAGKHRIPADKFTGYGKTHKTVSPTTTLMVPTGYGDGFPRSLSNRWEVEIQSQYFRIIGRVNMNQIVIKVREDLKLDDDQEVCLIDREGANDWYAAARLSDRFIYELLSNISTKIPRIVS
jgi:alanine racemase